MSIHKFSFNTNHSIQTCPIGKQQDFLYNLSVYYMKNRPNKKTYFNRKPETTDLPIRKLDTTCSNNDMLEISLTKEWKIQSIGLLVYYKNN